MKKYWILLGLFIIGLTLSAIHPHDYFTWILEVLMLRYLFLIG